LIRAEPSYFAMVVHWALETNLDEIVVLVRQFLSRVHTA
jgi:hypothetical protein